MRYLLFMGMTYYPAAGWSGFKGAYGTVEEAREVWNEQRETELWDWYQIVDSKTLELVEDSFGEAAAR